MDESSCEGAWTVSHQKEQIRVVYESYTVEIQQVVGQYFTAFRVYIGCGLVVYVYNYKDDR